MRAWLEIDLDRLRDNYQLIRRYISSGTELMAVLKADAYGYGISRIARELDLLGIDSFAVISLDEALQVRAISDRPVLIMGYLDNKEMAVAINDGFILSLYDRELATVMDRTGERVGKIARVHLKLETGLNRLGMTVDEAADLLTGQHRYPHLSIEAIFSHLATATDRSANLDQLRHIQDLLVKIQGRSQLLPIHLVSSYALANFPEGRFDGIRVGLALYGEDTVIPGLAPILTAKTVVMQIKTILPGEGVSYGHLFVPKNRMTIAIIAAGYAEGYTQALTGQAEVLVKGMRAKVLGKITMNMMIIDVTDLLGVKRGDEVVLIGSQRKDNGEENQITVSELAKWSNLRHHEIVTRFGTTLPRVYKGGN